MLRQLQLAMRKPVCHRTCIKVRLELDAPKLVSCQAEAPLLGEFFALWPDGARGLLRHIMPPGHQGATTDPPAAELHRQPQESAWRPVAACHQPITCPAHISIRSCGANIRLMSTWSDTCPGQRHAQGTCGLVAMTSASHAEGRQLDPGQVYV